MSIKMTLEQKQILSQKMIQSMNILQMNTMELESFINEMAVENPVIEVEDQVDYKEQALSKQMDVNRKLNWLESTDYQNAVYYHDDENDNSWEANWQDMKDQGESLAEFLQSQLIQRELSPKEKQINDYIIEGLNPDGYFTEDIRETAEYLNVSVSEVEEMLMRVQELDPAGVGARNLSECLLIQLKRYSLPEDLLRDTELIIREYLSTIAKNHLQVVSRKMKLPLKRVEECCNLIRSMNPKPGNCFNDRSHFQYISPDVVVVKFEDHFDVLVNEYQYPVFHINSYYEHLAKSTDDKQARSYLKEKIKQARDISDSIKYRVSTLSKIAVLLVERQKQFFMYGPGHKQTLYLADIADELELHISTVSRALSNKYLQCSWGVYPLNYFLTAAVTAGKPGETMTQEKIISKIEKIVDEEDKNKPLSDQKIADLLKIEGIDISRRTVSKYRGIRGIPDKSGRKKLE